MDWGAVVSDRFSRIQISIRKHHKPYLHVISNLILVEVDKFHGTANPQATD